MEQNKQVIEKFYTSFQNLDWENMIGCYHPAVFFYDPVFENLEGNQVKKMWQMLCTQAKDFSLEFHGITTDKEYGSCEWVANYTFSKTGRKVKNTVRSHFKFFEGKIIEHMDDFDIWKWSRQALGISGWLLGWSSLVKKKIRKNAKYHLAKFQATVINEK